MRGYKSAGNGARILATGGASQNNAILQVLADVLNSPVYVQVKDIFRWLLQRVTFLIAGGSQLGHVRGGLSSKNWPIRKGPCRNYCSVAGTSKSLRSIPGCWRNIRAHGAKVPENRQGTVTGAKGTSNIRPRKLGNLLLVFLFTMTHYKLIP